MLINNNRSLLSKKQKSLRTRVAYSTIETIPMQGFVYLLT